MTKYRTRSDLKRHKTKYKIRFKMKHKTKYNIILEETQLNADLQKQMTKINTVQDQT